MSRLTTGQADRRILGPREAMDERPSQSATSADAHDDPAPVPVATRMRVIILLALGLWVVIGGVAAVLLA